MQANTNAGSSSSFLGAAHVAGDVFSGHGFGLSATASAAAASKGNYVKIDMRSKKFKSRKKGGSRWPRRQRGRGKGDYTRPSAESLQQAAEARAASSSSVLDLSVVFSDGSSASTDSDDDVEFTGGPDALRGGGVRGGLDAIDVCLDVEANAHAGGKGSSALLPGAAGAVTVTSADLDRSGTLLVADSEDAAALAAVQADLSMAAAGDAAGGRSVKAAPPPSDAMALARKPTCPGHGLPAKVCRVKKSGSNKGRAFYVCPLPRTEQCKYFMWKDQHVAHAVAAFLGTAASSVDTALTAGITDGSDEAALAASGSWQRMERDRGVVWHAEALSQLKKQVRARGLLRDPALLQAVLGRPKALISKLVKMQLVALLARDDVREAQKKMGLLAEGGAVGGAAKKRRSSSKPGMINLDSSSESSGDSGSDSDVPAATSSKDRGKRSAKPGRGGTAAGEDTPSDLDEDELLVLNAVVGGEDTPAVGDAVLTSLSPEQRALDALQTHFGFPNFREGQSWVVQRTLAGLSTLYVAPTGSGKSLTYQLPSLLLPGITVVVSPLVALMKDQLRQLPPALRGTALVGAQTAADIGAALRALKMGVTNVLFVSPERLLSSSFARLASSAGSMPPVSLVCVDEAHCMSEWSHNFRPAYLQLGDAIPRLFGQTTPVLALTATATPEAVADVCRMLRIDGGGVRSSSWRRPNLHLRLLRTHTDESKQAFLRKLLGDPALLGQPCLVYATYQASAEAVASYLHSQGVKAAAYHAGLPDTQRNRVQTRFMQGTLQVVVATVAFGMGINMSNIRCVVHYDPPKSLEEYVQQVGRAGRDGQPSAGVLLMAPPDMQRIGSLVHSSAVAPAAASLALLGVWAPLLWGAASAAPFPQTNVAGVPIQAPVQAYSSVTEDWTRGVCGLPSEATETLLSLAGEFSGHAVRFWRANTWAAVTFNRHNTLQQASEAGGALVKGMLALAAVAQTGGMSLMMGQAACFGPACLARADTSGAHRFLEEDGKWVWRGGQGALTVKVHLASLANALGWMSRDVMTALRQAELCREISTAWLGRGWMVQAPLTPSMPQDWAHLTARITADVSMMQHRASEKLSVASAVFTAAAVPLHQHPPPADGTGGANSDSDSDSDAGSDSDGDGKEAVVDAAAATVPALIGSKTVACLPATRRDTLGAFHAAVDKYFAEAAEGVATHEAQHISSEEEDTLRQQLQRTGSELAVRAMESWSAVTAALHDATVPCVLRVAALLPVAEHLAAALATDVAAAAAAATHASVRSRVARATGHDGAQVWGHPMAKYIAASCGSGHNAARSLCGVARGAPHASEGRACSLFGICATAGMSRVLGSMAALPAEAPAQEAAAADESA